MVAPSIAHTVNAAGVSSVFIWTESLSVSGVLRDRPGLHTLNANTADTFSKGLTDYLGQDLPGYELDRLVLQTLGHPLLPSTSLDSRVEAALSALSNPDLYSAERPIARIASLVELSPSRLRHLFQTQVGVSLKRYRVWQRLMAALRASAMGVSLTEAAHTAGFADSAHLSRVYRATFGLKPSQVFGNSRLVQVKLHSV